MQPFLHTVAAQYAARYRSLDNFCFVFPGRRSASFFLKYLRSELGNRTMLAPRTATISDIVAELSGRIVDNRIDLLAVLYQAYVGVMSREGVQKVRDFDSFRSLGETILSDFNDIDSHLVDARALYSNLSDLNEISADYLTDEQREVLREYFGVEDTRAHIEQFWRHYGGCSEDSALKHKFIYLWEKLGEVYDEFNARLDSEGLTYGGRAYRLACERVAEEGAALFADSKMVFVGFNVLTTAEWRLFDTLRRETTIIDDREEPFADFVWDIPGRVMADAAASASRFVRRGMRRFPKPEWLDLSACDTVGIPPRIEVCSAPSNVAQAKIAGMSLAALHASQTQEEFDNARIAVVLPDENLLLPLINSVPEEIGSVNLTMGCSIRYSPVSSFVALIRRLQKRARQSGGRDKFFHEDVKALLSHPLTQMLTTHRAIVRARGAMMQNRLFMVDAEDLLLDADDPLRLVLQHLSREADRTDTVSYIDTILRRVLEAEEAADNPASETSEDEDTGEDPAAVPTGMESLGAAHLRIYIQALRRLDDALGRRGIETSPATLFLLMERMIAGETVQFEGEPVKGLQVMGLLETRSLDFEHIIIPSMNERIFPRRLTRRSFIPDTLRKGYGLPTTRSQESIFAYYFFRLISRARSLSMIYDSRVGEMKTGDPSRYILQLEHLYARDTLCRKTFRFNISERKPSQISVTKNAETLEILNKFTVPGGKRLSASRLKEYLKCPLSFYYKTILGMSDEQEPTEFLSAIEQGNIVHKVMMQIYADPELEDSEHQIFETPRRVIPAADVPTLVRRAVNTEYLRRQDADAELTGEAAIQCEVITGIINKVLENDRNTRDLKIIGLEAKFEQTVRIGERDVNFVMFIDRIDSYRDDEGLTRTRIIDYKTGKPGVTAADFEDIFNGSYKAGNLVQLLLYCDLLTRNDRFRHLDLQPAIYSTSKAEVVFPEIGKTRIKGHMQTMPLGDDGENMALCEKFRERLYQEIEGLFDPEVPFRATDDKKKCEYCPFRHLCSR